MRRTLCLFHYPCIDGITAALAAHLHHQQANLPIRMLPNTTFNPLTVDDLQLTGSETVYLLDFAGPPGFAREVARRAGRCIVLDHHKTSAEDLTGRAAAAVAPPNLEVHFDMQRSGATIALDYFQPQGLTPHQLELFKYVEDADLWRWVLPDSRAFHAGLTSLALDLHAANNPAIFDQLLALTPAEVIAAGKPELQRQAALVAGAVRECHEIELGGEGRGWGRALAVVVAPDVARLRDQLGNELAAEASRRGLRSMAAVAYEEAGIGDASMLKVSLRSVGEDTTQITQAYGGGGHRNASACLMSKDEFATWAV